MTDQKLFKAAMAKMGFTQKTLAEAMGISVATLNMKIHNERQFKSAEIVVLKKLLNLDASERDLIFFAE